VGGRGMNIGFEDALVFSELLKRGELDKYTQLRKPVLDHMVKRVNSLTDMFLNVEHSYMRPFMPYFLPVARRFMKKNLLTFVQGLDHPIGV
jgi:2-polyprenyl-6-methoxyphenol hydroxylase-like FAD-dependent oxidoreductase